MSDQRYPLAWPTGWKRTEKSARKPGRFAKCETQYGAADAAGHRSSWKSTKDLSVFEAVQRVRYELSRLGVRDGDGIISTNVPIRLDGLPRSDKSDRLDDPGVAVYWTLRNKKESIATDQYTRVADNLAAIAATLEAFRAVERHGGAQIIERVFTGFAQLPETTSGKSWREVLGINGGKVDRTEVITKFKSLLRARHPDAGGSDSEVHELLWARDQALQEIGQ